MMAEDSINHKDVKMKAKFLNAWKCIMNNSSSSESYFPY